MTITVITISNSRSTPYVGLLDSSYSNSNSCDIGIVIEVHQRIGSSCSVMRLVVVSSSSSTSTSTPSITGNSSNSAIKHS